MSSVFFEQISRITTILLAVVLGSCVKGKDFFKQQKSGVSLSTVATEQGAQGQITARLNAKSNVEQMVTGSGDTDKVAITFPPGSLAINTTISMELGETLVSNSLQSELALESSLELKIASSSVNFTSSVPTDATSAYTIALPIAATGLKLFNTAEYLTVVYQVTRQAEGASYKGIIPTNEIEVRNGLAYFATKYFGTYQLAYTSKPIVIRTDVVTTAPILTKSAMAAMEVFSLQDVKLSYASDSKTFAASVSASGFKNSGASCWIFVDRDRVAPFDHQVKISESLSADLTADDPTPATYAAKFECTNGNGLFAASAWGGAAVVAEEAIATDRTAPTLSISSPASGSTVNSANVSAVNVSGTCDEEASTISLTGAASGSATCISGSWSATLNLSGSVDGTLTVTAIISDLSGNSSAPALLTLIKDSTPPTATISSPAAGSYINIASSSLMTFSGSCSENGQMVYLTSPVTGSSTCSSGTWFISASIAALSSAAHSVSITFSDSIGNQATVSHSIVKDVTAPAIAILAPAPAELFNAAEASSVTVSGSCSENGRTVTITSPVADSTTCISGAWTKTLNMSGVSDGSPAIAVSMADAAGNSSSDTRSIEKDATPPTLSITAGAFITPANFNAFLIGGTCNESGQNVTISGTISSTATCTAGLWEATFDLSGEADGAFTFSASISDVAGNFTTVSASATKDTVSPPPMGNFSARPGFAPGEIIFDFDFPTPTSDYANLKILMAAGVTAPHHSCTSGSQEYFTDTNFTDGRITIASLAPGDVYSFRLCIYDAADNLTSNSVSTSEAGGLTIFTTSDTFDGDFQQSYLGQNFSAGLFGADYRCQKAAEQQDLPGHWRALLSETFTAANDRLNIEYPVYNMLGQRVADNAATLWGGSISNSINLNELGVANISPLLAWTGSFQNGEPSGGPSTTCQNWSANTGGNYGAAGDSSALSTFQFSSCINGASCSCSQTLRLICVGQKTPGLLNFTATPGSAGGWITLNLELPADPSEITSITIRKIAGATPPIFDCTNGETVNTIPNTSIPIAPIKLKLTSGSTYSFRACVYGPNGLLATSHSIDNVIIPSVTHHIIFVTKDPVAGNLSGVAGVEAVCSSAATSAGLPGSPYKALLSDSTINAQTNINLSGPVITTSGDNIAANEVALFNGELPNPILDEFGDDPTSIRAWTNTSNSGLSNSSNHCSNWTSNSGANYGSTAVINEFSHSYWLTNGGPMPCNDYAALYCISSALP